MKKKNVLFVAGSFPGYKDGIADAAGRLYEAFSKYSINLYLLTTDREEIKGYIEKTQISQYFLLKNWKINFGNLKKICEIVKLNNIECIHMDYPGDGYGKTFLATILPIFIKIYSKRNGCKIPFYIRLHEYSKARFLRKIAIMPMLRWCTAAYVPALEDRTILQRKYGKKIRKVLIGNNINKVQRVTKKEKEYINISYFGFVYHGKGIQRLFKIWKMISDKYGDKVKFTIIGELNISNNNHFQEYHKLAYKWLRDYDMIDKVRITGYLDNDSVSNELYNTDIATLFYEDGVTLRRGSLLAFLEHGVPIVTVQGDEESKELFRDAKGLYMCNNDEEIIHYISYLIENKNKLETIGQDNFRLAEYFKWDNIAKEALVDYKMI